LQGSKQCPQALLAAMLALIGAVLVGAGPPLPIKGLDFEVIGHGGWSSKFLPKKGSVTR
jgi:hypothetical protein